MSKKKLTLAITAVVLVLTMAIGGTLAYFTDKTEVKENTFTVGNVEITLTEPNWEGEGSVDAPEVYPGEALAKDPTVTNVGDNPCFVRVKVTGLDCLGDAGLIGLRHGNYVEGYDSDNWTLYDGYYYYNKVLATEDTAGDEWNKGLTTTTEPLFNQIVIPTALEGVSEDASLSIDIYAEAVQAQGALASYTDVVKNMTVAQIAAWFDTCGMNAAE